MPPTLHVPARLWLQHRAHHSPARAPLTNGNQQLHTKRPLLSPARVPGCHPEPASPSSSCGQHRLGNGCTPLATEPKPGFGTFSSSGKHTALSLHISMDAAIPGETRWKSCTFARKALYGQQEDGVMKKGKKKKIVPECSNITKEEAQGFQPTPISVLG